MVATLWRFGLKNFPLLLLSPAAALIFSLYLSIAMLRLSRWPVLAQPLVAAAGVFSLFLYDFRPYPILGPTLVMAPPMVFLVLTAPHWRKLNWAPFGQPYRAAEDPGEVFA